MADGIDSCHRGRGQIGVGQVAGEAVHPGVGAWLEVEDPHAGTLFQELFDDVVPDEP